MADINAVAVPAIGATLAKQPASAGGDTLETGRDVLLLVFNDSAGPVTATVTTPGTVGGLAVADAQLTVAAGAVGALQVSTDAFRGANGRAAITWSATATITFALIRAAR